MAKLTKAQERAQKRAEKLKREKWIDGTEDDVVAVAPTEVKEQDPVLEEESAVEQLSGKFSAKKTENGYGVFDGETLVREYEGADAKANATMYSNKLNSK